MQSIHVHILSLAYFTNWMSSIYKVLWYIYFSILFFNVEEYPESIWSHVIGKYPCISYLFIYIQHALHNYDIIINGKLHFTCMDMCMHIHTYCIWTYLITKIMCVLTMYTIASQWKTPFYTVHVIALFMSHILQYTVSFNSRFIGIQFYQSYTFRLESSFLNVLKNQFTFFSNVLK